MTARWVSMTIIPRSISTDFVSGVVLGKRASDCKVDRPALDEQHHRAAGPVIVVVVRRLHMHQHPVRRTVEADRDGQAEPRLRSLEDPV